MSDARDVPAPTPAEAWRASLSDVEPILAADVDAPWLAEVFGCPQIADRARHVTGAIAVMVRDDDHELERRHFRAAAPADHGGGSE